MKSMKTLGASLLLTLLIAGCSSSSTRSSEDDGTPPAVEQALAPADGEYLGEEGPYDDAEEPQIRCYNQYSDVVPVYVEYAPWHCEGWTGKVFCEYESLSSQYGPGWGTCQCYNTICEHIMTIKRGRSCRYRRCY
jgi:hypothetical protein